MNLQAGTVLQQGQYAIETRLGQGCFGATYRARHLRLERPVILKTLDECLRSHPEFDRLQQQFASSVRRFATRPHPHVVRVWDLFEEEGIWFAVLEALPGRTLDDRLRDSEPIRVDRALSYTRQIGSALADLHDRGLVHQDIKPDRIILSPDEETATLAGLGLAWAANCDTLQIHAGLRSGGYAAPEQDGDERPETPATDVYGLAATLYAAIAGRPPVPGCLRDRLRLERLPERRPDIDPAVDRAVRKGLSLDPEARPRTIAAWLDLLPDAIAAPDLPPPPAPIQSSARSSFPLRAYLWVPCLFVATSVTAALGGAGIVLGWRWHETRQSETEPPAPQTFPHLRGMPEDAPTDDEAEVDFDEETREDEPVPETDIAPEWDFEDSPLPVRTDRVERESVSHYRQIGDI